MRNPTARQCDYCGQATDYPVLIRVIEANTGPGGGVYGCTRCAHVEYGKHVRMCLVCRRGINCEEAVSAQELIAAAREARIEEARRV